MQNSPSARAGILISEYYANLAESTMFYLIIYTSFLRKKWQIFNPGLMRNRGR